jgi:hypothetical protein
MIHYKDVVIALMIVTMLGSLGVVAMIKMDARKPYTTICIDGIGYIKTLEGGITVKYEQTGLFVRCTR